MRTLTLPAVMENLETLISFVLTDAEEAGFDRKLQNKLRLAAEELLVNVISYAYPGAGGDVTMITDQITEPAGIRIEIIDSGVAFNPLEKPDPDINLPVEERQIGGLGIYLVKELMNHVSYRRENGKNILTFIKYHN